MTRANISCAAAAWQFLEMQSGQTQPKGEAGRSPNFPGSKHLEVPAGLGMIPVAVPCLASAPMTRNVGSYSQGRWSTPAMSMSGGCAGAKRPALQRVVRRKPVGTPAGASAQPSEQRVKRQKADAGSAARAADQDAAAGQDAEAGPNTSTEHAADDAAGPSADAVQSDAATQSGEHGGAQQHGADVRESVADPDGGASGSAGLTALLGDYGSDSDG